MDIREYLNSIKSIEAEIISLQAWVNKYHELAYSLRGTSFSEHISAKGYVTSSLETVIVELVDRENELKSAICKLTEREREIRQLISKIPDDTYRIILTRKYLDCQSLSQIAEQLHYSDKWIKVLHHRALDMAEEIYNTQ